MATVGEAGKPGRPRILKRTDLGRRIERIAASRGMTSYDLSAACGVSQPCLHRICTGGSPDPRLSTLIAIADALDVTLDRLVGRNGRHVKRTA